MRFATAKVLNGRNGQVAGGEVRDPLSAGGVGPGGWLDRGALMREKGAWSNQELRAFVGVPEDGLAVRERV